MLTPTTYPLHPLWCLRNRSGEHVQSTLLPSLLPFLFLSQHRTWVHTHTLHTLTPVLHARMVASNIIDRMQGVQQETRDNSFPQAMPLSAGTKYQDIHRWHKWSLRLGMMTSFPLDLIPSSKEVSKNYSLDPWLKHVPFIEINKSHLFICLITWLINSNNLLDTFND